MTDPDADLSTVVSLLDDDCARTILAATSEQPLSASELADRCDPSLATVSRRLDRLTDAGLVTERTRPRSDGHHDTVYAARLDRFEVRLRDGTFEFELDRDDGDAADQLTQLWGKL